MACPYICGVQGPILFFDGYCHLCDRTVQRMIRFDKGRIFRYAPLDGETAKKVLPEGEKPDSLILWHDGKMYSKSHAVMKIAGMLGWPMKLMYALYILPERARDFLYDFVARRRYRWYGRRESCKLPGPGEAELFLP